MDYYGHFGLGLLSEPLKLHLSVSSPLQEVGKEYSYRLIGATPGARIAWTSYKDGEFTGEYQSDYGQVVEANGTAELKWTPRAEDVGTWVKQVEIYAPDGSAQTALVQFRVVPAQPTTPTPEGVPPVYGGGGIADWLSQPLFYLGEFAITPGIAGVALGLFWVFGSKRR